MDRGERAIVIVGMLDDAADALVSDTDVEQVVCRALAASLRADVAVCFAPGGEDGGHLIGYHPDRTVADDLVGSLPRQLDGNSPHRVDHRQLGEVLVLLPTGVDPTVDGPRRGLAFARRAGFDEHHVLLLHEAAAPLMALLPHAVAATERRERTQAGREAAREFGLTARELEVLELLAQGLLATSIASRLSLSPRTVHKHLGNIYDKLGVHDRLVAVSLARERGLVAA